MQISIITALIALSILSEEREKYFLVCLKTFSQRVVRAGYDLELPADISGHILSKYKIIRAFEDFKPIWLIEKDGKLFVLKLRQTKEAVNFEATLKTLLSGTGLAPEVYEHYTYGDYHVLIEEFINGVSLNEYSTVNARKMIDKWLVDARNVWKGRDKLLCDTDPWNFIVSADDGRVVCIDMESEESVQAEQNNFLISTEKHTIFHYLLRLWLKDDMYDDTFCSDQIKYNHS